MSDPVACGAVLAIDEPAADRLLDLHGGDPPDARQRPRRLARALLQALLLERCGPGPWPLQVDQRGKPVLACDQAHDIDISLGHAGRYVVAAFSRVGPVGIDIEAHARGGDLAGIAAYAFGIQERQRVADGGAPAFFRIWTLREAMGKATGEGLALAADAIDRTAPAPFEGAWVQEDGVWLLAHRFAPPQHSLALAIKPRQPSLVPAWDAQSICWQGLALRP